MAAATLAACSTGGASAQANDRPEGPISDLANILPPDTEAALDRELRDYFDQTGNELIVSSVTSLDGKPIELVSLDTARRWGVGDRETMRGLLILVAPNERQVRIEVSCGLESVVTDEQAAAIIDKHMVPQYRNGGLAEGTVAGAEALMKLTREHRPALDAAHPPAACAKEAA